MRVPQISQTAYQNNSLSSRRQNFTPAQTDTNSNISFKNAYINMDEAPKKNKCMKST